MEIRLGLWEGQRVDRMPLEVVERKGIGHPDTLTDGIVEAVSRELSRYYLQNFGRVLHHNVDKALLVGGRARPELGGGRVEEPMVFYLVGRATLEVNGQEVPLRDLYEETAKRYLQVVRHLDPEADVEYRMWVRPGSPDLVDLFLRSEGVPLANDTSFGVGFYPLTPTEQAVLRLEQYLNSAEFKKRYPHVGEDIKVMAIREGDLLRVTVAAAMVSRYFSTADAYFEARAQLQEEATRFLQEHTPFRIALRVNTADTRDSFYITVTGTSAEGGDDGQVGRGNRVNGLITPLRPMSLEAAPGKNPISHVGKLYNVAAQRLARRIATEVDEIEEAYVLLVSAVGEPVNRPQAVHVWVQPQRPGTALPEGQIRNLVHEELDRIPQLYHLILDQQVTLY